MWAEDKWPRSSTTLEEGAPLFPRLSFIGERSHKISADALGKLAGGKLLKRKPGERLELFAVDRDR